MREIKTLIQKLRSYPPNWFIYPDSRNRNVKELDEKIFPPTIDGLTVCDLDGNFKGFIETGTNDGEVVVN